MYHFVLAHLEAVCEESARDTKRQARRL